MSDDNTTWTEICQKVYWGEGLYQSCRDKVEGFTGFQNGAFDEELEQEDSEDFDKLLRRSAQPIPDPPASTRKKKKSKKPEGLSGVIDEVMHGELGRYLLFGGGAALLAWWFLLRNKQEVVVTSTPTAMTPSASAPAAKAA